MQKHHQLPCPNSRTERHKTRERPQWYPLRALVITRTIKVLHSGCGLLSGELEHLRARRTGAAHGRTRFGTRAAGQRWPIEELFRDEIQQVNLAGYQSRRVEAQKAHIAMVLLASVVLQ